jgi:hypothetical protein
MMAFCLLMVFAVAAVTSVVRPPPAPALKLAA